MGREGHIPGRSSPCPEGPSPAAGPAGGVWRGRVTTLVPQHLPVTFLCERSSGKGDSPESPSSGSPVTLTSEPREGSPSSKTAPSEQTGAACGHPLIARLCEVAPPQGSMPRGRWGRVPGVAHPWDPRSLSFLQNHMVASVSRLLFLVKYVLGNTVDENLWHVLRASLVQGCLVSVLTATHVVPVSRVSPAKGQRVRAVRGQARALTSLPVGSGSRTHQESGIR